MGKLTLTTLQYWENDMRVSRAKSKEIPFICDVPQDFEVLLLSLNQLKIHKFSEKCRGKDWKSCDLAV